MKKPRHSCSHARSKHGAAVVHQRRRVPIGAHLQAFGHATRAPSPGRPAGGREAGAEIIPFPSRSKQGKSNRRSLVQREEGEI